MIKPLVQLFCGIRFVLVIKPFVVFRQFRDIDRLVIGDPFKSLRTQRPLFFFFLQLFDRLGYDISPLSHMIVFTDGF